MASDQDAAATVRPATGVEPLRIAFFSPSLPDRSATNGVVTYTGIMRDALRLLGHSVLVVTPYQIEHFDGEICDLPPLGPIVRRLNLLMQFPYRQRGSSSLAWLQVLRAFKTACRAGADVFEIEESFGWAGRLTARGTAIVERLHGPHVYGREPIETVAEKRVGDLREMAEAASFIRVQALTCPSERLLAAIAERYNLKLPPLSAIPNPIPAVSELSKWHVQGAHCDSILCVGRFDLRKGADIVIKAFALALERRPTLRLVMVGPDSGLKNADGTLTHFHEFLEAKVAPEARSRISFIGPQARERISTLRLKSGFAVVGSRFENFPYSIAEAMSVGMPVLASDSFGNAEMIRQNVDGRIVPVGDTEAMCRAMVEMAASPATLARMGRSASSRVAEWLCPERIARQTEEVYREAIYRRVTRTS